MKHNIDPSIKVEKVSVICTAKMRPKICAIGQVNACCLHCPINDGVNHCRVMNQNFHVQPCSKSDFDQHDPCPFIKK